MKSETEKKMLNFVLKMLFVIFIGIILVCAIFGCKATSDPRTVIVPDTVYVHDTIVDTTNIAILNGLLSNRIGTINELQKQIDVMSDSLVIYRKRRASDDDNRAALIQIREYNELCRKNPTLKKYLSGWINRALKFAHYEESK